MDGLKAWFHQEKRDLPWRSNPTPYRVWISEVMLQQTQVVVVIGYFERWMQKFPDVKSLAEASLDEVMKAWEGLGYYSRARSLHRAAQIILKEFQGEVPSQKEALEKLPGFGPYTVGAVLSFAFHQKALAIDGNVRRVIARLQPDLETLLPDKEPWVVMEALIELGATVCQKKPKCLVCPLKEGCRAYQEGTTHLLPISKQESQTIPLLRDVAIVIAKDHVLVRQEKVGKVMGGLYEFPYVERGMKWTLGLKMKKIQQLPQVKHSFTKFRATLFPALYQSLGGEEQEEYRWVFIKDLLSYPFSSGHRRILKEFLRAYSSH
jgi:A/G-specific adenine glycosylase